MGWLPALISRLWSTMVYGHGHQDERANLRHEVLLVRALPTHYPEVQDHAPASCASNSRHVEQTAGDV